MNEQLLKRIEHVLSTADTYPGYPTERLTIDSATLEAMDTIELPAGPWEINNDDAPTPEERDAFIAAGYRVDANGRPLHPALYQMITNPEVGVVTGKGKYWNWGPNYTADPIVITKTATPRVLLIQRGDTGSWALPGGFVDPEDADASIAALRELSEEANLSGLSDPQEVYVGVVADTRTTAHAWAETSAYLFQVDQQVPVAAGDDAVDARWVRLDALNDTLFGSHGFLVEQAITRAVYEHKKPIHDILSQPKESLDVEIIDAGHMAYDHLFVRDADSTLFVKEHVAERFDDPFREAHSRAYLEKEFALFEHAAERGYAYIPDRVELVNDALLAMDALHEDDGWLWRAPEDERTGQYIRDTLQALDHLALVPVPKNPQYWEHINPTYETFWREGWDDLTPEKIPALEAKVAQLTASWSPEQQAVAQHMMREFSVLQARANNVNRDVEMVMAHNDARQSNIAWHPDHGAKLVDWSWGDPAPRNADSTMFLIDLVKAGYDVSDFTEKVDVDQLITLIGFWLAHSLWQTRDGSTTVREQQVASAAAAYRLLTELEQTD